LTVEPEERMRTHRLLISLGLLAITFVTGGRATAQSISVVPPKLTELPGTEARHSAAAQSGSELVGLFAIQAGSCDEAPSGSYFRMVQPGGSPASGPFVSNGDSPCGDDTYTPLRPGTDGGIATGAYQPHPDPTFDAGGNALAERITQPQGFFSVRFSTATNSTDPQTNTKVSPPRLYNDAGKLTGDVRAFAASWNRQHFNQGSPKPDGSRPGNTAGPTGTFNAESGAFVLEWSSQIVGGPFNNFTGIWHFVGTFRAGERPAPSSGGGTSVSGSAAPAAGAESGQVSTPGGPLARTGGGVSTFVGLALVALAAAPRLVRHRRERR
jgi:hypothetical protein